MLDDLTVDHLDLDFPVIAAFGLDRIPLDRVHDEAIHFGTAAHGLEAVPPSMIRRHIRVVDTQTADPLCELVADAHVGRADAIWGRQQYQFRFFT
jgi:hypothetical protein